MVKMTNARRHFGDEALPGFGQPDTTMAALEQENAKRLLQRLDPRANA
ncbi:hypothetical protein CRBSH125_33100 [Afipia carboxidovorans]|nr:hypothetical protein CRBSH125_33100 [Afipia carboxidovorans]